MAIFASDPSFHDFPNLVPLGDIADDLGMTLTLFGGAASRAVMADFVGRSHGNTDIFDLAPFSSDFDLRHNGTKEDSVKLRRSIQSEIPFASWFRWAIQDNDTAQKAQEARAKSMYVPLRQITIGNHGTTHVPPAAMRDMESRRVSFERNPRMEESTLIKERRDFEVFGYMLAVNAHLDMQEITGESSLGLDEDSAATWLSIENLELQFREMAESPLAISRFWNLFINQISRMGMERVISDPATSRIYKAARLLPNMQDRLDGLVEGLSGASVSRTLAKDTLRVAEMTPKVMTGVEARTFCEELLNSFVNNSVDERIDAKPSIDPALELIAAVREIIISPNQAVPEIDRDDYDPFYSAAVDEFVEFTWRPDPNQLLNPYGITACVIPYSSPFSVPYAFDVPAVGGVFSASLPWVRIRLDDLIPHSKEAFPTKAAVLIFQARS